ncbi:hypothetical protein HDU76_003391, partial [Blyttiomyces sp. JEL0837]
MQVSYRDRLPAEIKSIIIRTSDPLTRFINNDLTEQDIKLHDIEIWKVAFENDYDGDLGQLPQEHLPNIHNGLKLVHSRNIDLFESFHKLLLHIPIIQDWADEIPDWWNTDDNGVNVFYLACSIGHLDLVNSILPSTNFDDEMEQYLYEGFDEACAMGYLDVVKYLLESDMGIELAVDEFYGMTNAAAHGHEDVVSYRLDKCMLASTTNGGVEWDIEGTFEKACQFGHFNVVKVLKTVVDVEILSDDTRANVLLCAVMNRNVDMLKYLVEDMGLNDVVLLRDMSSWAETSGFQ